MSVSPQTTAMWNLLGGLGSHDLSVMREALGMPTSVLGASMGYPFWNALFQYPGFIVSYESVIDNIPRFDAYIEVYGVDKSIRVQCDSPYAKGFPVTMHIAEKVGGVYRETTLTQTYEDPYTLEFRKLYALVAEGIPVKTTAEDAKGDLKMFGMIMQQASKSEFMTGSAPIWSGKA